MKLATRKSNSRDGQLLVVNRELSRCVEVSPIAPNLQSALDNWSATAPLLQAVSDRLNLGEEPAAKPFNHAACAAPLPRAYQWVDGSAYLNHVELVRRARGAKVPESFWNDPLIYQGGSDSFLGPHDDIPLASEEWGIDFEAEVAVIADDVPMGVSVERAAQHICLIALVNDISLRNLIPAELAKGFGFYQSKPSSAFSPICVTPEELGDAWRGGKVHLPLRVDYNEKPFGRAEAGEEMTFSFPQLIAHAAKSRPLGAGSIVGSGTVSNKMNGGPGKPVAEGGRGYSCIAEFRMIETIDQGQPETGFMRFGDRVRIEMKSREGESLFGAIDQRVVAYSTS